MLWLATSEPLTLHRRRSILRLTGAPRRPAHWRRRRGFIRMDISRAFSLMLVATSLLAACAPVETPIAGEYNVVGSRFLVED